MDELQETQVIDHIHVHTHTRCIAELFADECIAALARRMADNQDDEIRVEVSHDSLDLTIRDDRRVHTERPAEEFTFPIEELQELEIEIAIVGSNECRDLELESYIMCADTDELSRDAVIRVDIVIPTNRFAHDILRGEIVAALVHEMRHAIQHCVWRLPPVHDLADPDLDAEDHLFDALEVDARVEEICSYSTQTIDQMSVDTFESLARRYIRNYINRNDLHSELQTGMEEAAVCYHVEFFVKRARFDEFRRPA